jgi:excinuclease ABC subunit A
MGLDKIVIRGARAHNLKSVDLDLPRDALTVITGLSGSGKSSLAFDTIYAEGQRRYVESLSAYARQFLGLMEKPDLDYIEGLSPAISIEQRTTARNPRSTVGTITEIYDYLRLLFARVGEVYCYNCGREVASQTVDQIVDRVLEGGQGGAEANQSAVSGERERDARFMIAAPIVRGRKGEFKKVFQDVVRGGFVRIRVDGEIMRVEQALELNLDRHKKHTIEVIVDRMTARAENRTRLAESVETAAGLTDGLVAVLWVKGPEQLYSSRLACVYCGISYPEIQPRLFSFNSPYGACPECAGLGVKQEFDPDLIIPDKSLSFDQGAVRTHNPKASWSRDSYTALVGHFGYSTETPVEQLPDKVYQQLLYGSEEEVRFVHKHLNGKGRWDYTGRYEGIVRNLERRYRETKSEAMREWMEEYMTEITCPACGGRRLRPEALSVKIDGRSIIEVTRMPVDREIGLFQRLLEEGEVSPQQRMIALPIIKEIGARLGFLRNVGLGYLSLDRKAETLSGGEAQRIRLATQIGSGLMGVLYILDEPTIGLHQRDNSKLLETLFRLRDMGNTLILVEHDQQTILSADNIVDLGPGAGEEGGRVIAQGTPDQIKRDPKSLTGKYLSGERAVPIPEKRRAGSGMSLLLEGAAQNNLKDIDVVFPLGTFIAVTGVSGSGKSSLVNDLLYPALANRLNRASRHEGACRELRGTEHLDKVIDIDQSPIGRTPRSNPATYTGVFTPIRDLFAGLPEARIRGYKPGRFSFNVQGGRCENCQGQGTIRIEMNFLPDIYVVCEVCKGTRYNRETLEVRYKGLSISQVLDLTVDEAAELFAAIPQIKSKLKTLIEVGLGYIRLGQPATTLSGGEAQRVKLSAELARRSTGKTLYILDEPTSGLHFEDTSRLLSVLQRLVDKGNTVLVIEHNLDVVASADHLIDLGPEGGEAGGRVVCTGTPEQVAAHETSHTGRYLRRHLSRQAVGRPPSR